MKTPADNAHRDLAANDLDTAYLVEAAAGTGKTTLLVSRVMAALKTGRAALPQICAITFTEKAAGELKVRLRRTIESELRNGGKHRGILRAALADLDAMSVGTIHSFCADLIRERPVEAGVDPGFVTADELAAGLLFDRTWSDWLAEVLSGDHPAFRRCVEAGLSPATGGNTSDGIPGLAHLLVENRDLLETLTTDPKWTDANFATALEGIHRHIAMLENAAASCKDAQKDRGAAQIRGLAAWREGLRLRKGKETEPWLKRMPRINAASGAKGNWSPPETLAEVKRVFARLKDNADEMRRAFAHNLLVDLIDALKPFVERFDEAKAQTRLLDFQDLLLRARDMLRDSRPAREYLKGRFRFILVDEFQDTDPLQTEIVFFLAEKAGAFARTWDAVAPQPGKLFLVGDPRQSIYGFRRADLDLYGRVRRVVAEHGRVLNLNVNFRALPEILGEINDIFAPLMIGPVAGRFEPEHAPMEAYRSAAGDGSKVLRLRPPEELRDADAHAAEARRNESGAVAACIARMVADGVPVFDKEAGKIRPCAYRDVGVLFRAATGIEELEDAFRAHDVPYRISGGKHYYARLEFQDLLNVLRAIGNPFDGLSVVGALRSPFFGASDAEILAHFAAGGTFNYLHDVPPEARALSDALETLKEMHERRATHAIPAVITDLFERTQALQIYAMKPHGEQRVANLLKVRDMARSLSAQGVSSFPAFVRWIGRMQETGQTESESPIAETDDDLVQFMTFHKAKGLEFPVVFLANLDASEPGKDKFIVGRSTGRVDVKIREGLATIGWEDALADAQDRAEYERRRLFYVAMTRARDFLVLPAGWSSKDGRGFLAYLPADEPPSADRPDFLRVTPAEVLRRRRDDFRLKPPESEEMTETAKGYWEHKVAWRSKLADRTTRLNSARRMRTATEEIERDDAEPLPLARRDAGSEALALGNLVHRLMETADLGRADEDLFDRAVREAKAMGLDEERIQEAAREATELVRRTLGLPVMRERAGRAENVYREVPFAANYGDELLEGRVDAVFTEPDGAVILDYKTDRVTAEQAVAEAERYRPQAQVYRDAMTAALGMPVKEVIFVFCRPGVAVSLGALDRPEKED